MSPSGNAADLLNSAAIGANAYPRACDLPYGPMIACSRA